MDKQANHRRGHQDDRDTGTPSDPVRAAPGEDAASPRNRDRRRIDRLLTHLPRAVQGPVRWLMKPSARWVRLPAAILLIVGGLLSFLPVLGIWMLPLGLVLLAEDVRLLAHGRGRVLDWIERHRPHWLRKERP